MDDIRMTSVALLLVTLAAAVALPAMHALDTRLGITRRLSGSLQMRLVWLTALLNVPLVMAVWWVFRTESRAPAELPFMVLFGLVVYNGVGYAYFHVFNMSETARRIHMLICLHRQESATPRELFERYSPTDMIDARLRRLVDMKQLSCRDDGRFIIADRQLLVTARLIECIRRMLGPRRANTAG